MSHTILQGGKNTVQEGKVSVKHALYALYLDSIAIFIAYDIVFERHLPQAFHIVPTYHFFLFWDISLTFCYGMFCFLAGRKNPTHQWQPTATIVVGCEQLPVERKVAHDDSKSTKITIFEIRDPLATLHLQYEGIFERGHKIIISNY